MVNVYCVKVGTKYDRSFVEKLKSSIEKHFTIEHKFYCLTDKELLKQLRSSKNPVQLISVFSKING